jgi:hypothetical protein
MIRSENNRATTAPAQTRRQAVLHGDRHRACLHRNDAQVVVVQRCERLLNHECAVVEERAIVEERAYQGPFFLPADGGRYIRVARPVPFSIMTSLDFTPVS